MAERQIFKHKRNCSRGNKIALENTNKAPNFGYNLGGVEYDVYIENYRLQELNKVLQSFTLRLVDVILSC